ncbi:MAG: Na+/H+ antiporter NhaA [Ardenticatenia bacterium]|nr:Na+/H+ antiporter NhaA [Ardenticatenia bacterium]
MAAPSLRRERVGPPLPRPLQYIVTSFQRFAELEASGGLLILFSATLAMIWANSPWEELYHRVWETELVIGFEPRPLIMPLEKVINDALMTVFFFVVGLEIKREVTVGELSSPRRVMFPLMAAVGGMAMPALIYVTVMLVFGTPEYLRGWGIPVATDIAFALGVLALLGRRAPSALKIFLTTLAIADDIGGILVIALFYTAELNVRWLLVGLAVFGMAMLLARARIHRPWPYFLLGLIVWWAFLQSGVHATIAGVLMAFAIPVRRFLDREEFIKRSQQVLYEMREHIEHSSVYRSGLATLEALAEQAQSTLQRLETELHPWVAFVIVPLFALANAGVTVEGDTAGTLSHPVFLGVLLGLFVGKPLGITLMSWLGVRLGLAERPASLAWRHVFGVGWLGGIGFTVALFIANLAFPGHEVLDYAKLGILGASLMAGLIGYGLLFTFGPQVKGVGQPEQK